MAITYPLTMPTAPQFKVSGFRFQGHTTVHASPLSRAEQVLARSGQKWSGTLTLPAMYDEAAQAWRAFGVSLNGRAGTFYAFDPTRRTPRGTGGGSPFVKGAQPRGTTDLATDGWGNNNAGVLLPGDYIELQTGGGNELKMVLNQVDSNATGEATVTIAPPLHKDAANNDSIVTVNPRGRFRLADDAFGWDLDEMRVVGVTLAMVEAVPEL